MFEIISAFGPKRRDVVVVCTEPGAKQSHKDECDINKILDQFKRTGMINFVNNNSAMYADVSDVDFQGAMNDVARVRQMFEQLPAHVRARLGHDPANFVEVLGDPEQEDLAVELGLKEKVVKAEPVSEPGPPAEREAGAPVEAPVGAASAAES